MCHQSVGLVARHLEAAGFPTVTFSSARTITERVNPPRAVFVDLPLGHTTGLPDDPDGQRALLREGLAAALRLDRPGSIVDLPYRYVDDDWKAQALGWSRRRQDDGTTAEPAGDTRTARSPEPRYQTEDDRRAAERVDWDRQCRVCVGIEPGGPS